MDRLKKKIIYQYIIVSSALVIVSVYLYFGVGVIDKYFSNNGVVVYFNSTIVSIGIELLVILVSAYYFYKKIDKYIKKEMQDQLKKQSKLFADIAHDIKNPMTTVLGLSRALESGVASKEEESEVTHLIVEKAKRIDKIINLMFQYAKMDSPEYKLNKRKVNISRITKELIAERYNEFEEKNMMLNILITDDNIMACVDELEISRVIDNLINNVLVHNPGGVKIEIGLTSNNEKIKLWVADSGNLISDEIKEKIFKPFVCEDESRNSKGGTGLGLAICKKIIELHGGEIFIEENFNGYKKAFIFNIKKL